jgi:TRAP-type C4-dicarboxylate transport system permease large subunit
MHGIAQNLLHYQAYLVNSGRRGSLGKCHQPKSGGGIGAGAALIIAMLQRRLSRQTFFTTFVETVNTSVMLYVVLFGAMLFAKLISFSGLADGLLSLVQDSGLSRMGILLAILAVFLILGCVMDAMAIILIFVPLFSPLLISQGFDLIWFGIIVVVLTEIGLITPPIGMNVFVLKANLPNVPVKTIFKGLIPFIAIDVVRLTLLVAFPAISLYLVSLMK